MLIDEEALQDVADAYDYYLNRSAKVANEFYMDWIQSVHVLKLNPNFRIRYKSIRCLPLLKFPFMIHFEVNEMNREVNVFALIHTHRDPEVNYLREPVAHYMLVQHVSSI